MPLDKRRRANLSVVDEEFGYTLEGGLARHLGFIEQWPHLRLVPLLRGREVFVQV